MLVNGAIIPFPTPFDEGSQFVGNALTSGTINGISYSYGTLDYSASGNITRSDNGTVIEQFNETVTATRPMKLVKNITHTNTIFTIEWTEFYNGDNASFRDHHTQETLDYFVNVTLLQDMPLRFDPLNAANGLTMMKLNVTENFTTEIAYAISTTGEFLGQFPVNTTFVEYWHKYLNGTVTRREGIIFPQYLIFELETQEYNVTTTKMKVGYSQVSYSVRHSVAYNVSASAHFVNITDGENFGLSFTMFDVISANYTSVVSSWMGYYFKYIDYTELKFENGTTVPWGMYPRHLLPVTIEMSGTAVEVGFQKISSKVLSTFQSVVSAFVSRESTNSSGLFNPDAVKAKLAVWGIQTSTTLAAYEDGNENGRLDLRLENDGVEVDSEDRVAYLGLGEAFSTTVVNGLYTSEVSNFTANFWGLGVNITEMNKNDTRLKFNVEKFGHGDPNAASNNTFRWSEPVANTDGSVDFDFGVTYYDFPVTWVNVTNPANSFVDNEDIQYDYKVHVDPSTGKATVSPTWTYEGITDPNKKAAMSGLSMAMIVKSEFFTAQATYSATETNETVPASRNKKFAKLGVRFGAGEPASEIDVTGPKANYTIGNNTYSANFDALTLVQVAGTVKGEQVTPLSSESADTGGTATVGSLVERLEVNFFYQASLVVISYPTWNGDGLVHDPDYSMNYQPKTSTTTTTSSETQPTETSTSDTATGTATDTATDTATGTTTSGTTTAPTTSEAEETPQSPLPGFVWYIALIPMTMLVILRKRKD